MHVQGIVGSKEGLTVFAVVGESSWEVDTLQVIPNIGNCLVGELMANSANGNSELILYHEFIEIFMCSYFTLKKTLIMNVKSRLLGRISIHFMIPLLMPLEGSCCFQRDMTYSARIWKGRWKVDGFDMISHISSASFSEQATNTAIIAWSFWLSYNVSVKVFRWRNWPSCKIQE